MDSIVAILLDLYPLALQLILAIVGGGIVSAIVTERWTRKRESHAIMLEHMATLIRSYHFYVRQLNSVPEDRESRTLDEAHAAFYAEARLLGLAQDLKAESERLIGVANSLFGIRKKTDLTKPEVEQALEPIFHEFGQTLESLQSKLRLKDFF